MTGTVQFKTASFKTLSAKFFTVDGHLMLLDIPKAQEGDVQRDLSDIANNAPDRFTTAYAMSKIEAAGFAPTETDNPPTYKCVRGTEFAMAVPEATDGEPVMEPTQEGEAAQVHDDSETPAGFVPLDVTESGATIPGTGSTPDAPDINLTDQPAEPSEPAHDAEAQDTLADDPQ